MGSGIYEVLGKDEMITQQELKNVLHYDQDTGIFRRLKVSSRKDKLNEIVGCDIGRGYLQTRINYKKYFLHRLAWLYVYGEYPNKFIDHINGNPSDNRICNLRQANSFENNQNAKISKLNTSGIKGVTWSKYNKKWEVKCRVMGKRYFLGLFEDINAAAETYKRFAEKYHGEFYRG